VVPSGELQSYLPRHAFCPGQSLMLLSCIVSSLLTDCAFFVSYGS